MNVIFDLLKVAMWQSRPTLHLYPQCNWEEIWIKSKRLSVVGLVGEAVLSLPEEMLPCENLVWKWISALESIKHRNLIMNSCIDDIYTLLRAHHLFPLLMKGQSVAQYYSNPLIRECGDIDLFFPKKEERKKAAQLLITKYGYIMQNNKKDETWLLKKTIHDPNFNIFIELHTKGMSLFHNIKERGKHILDESQIIEYRNWILPSMPYALLYTSLHILKHATTFGIGLKQICDLAMILDHMEPAAINEININLTYSWNALLNSLLEEIGVDKSKLLPTDDKKKSPASLIAIIRRGGNFGFYRQLRNTPLSFSIILRNIFGLYKEIGVVSLIPAMQIIKNKMFK